MKLFITKKNLIKKFAEELAYLQIRADYWFYCYPYEIIDKDTGTTKQDMSDRQLEYVYELRCICHDLGILKEVYEEAYKIYDFRNSGKKDFVADMELIRKLNREFCEHKKKKRPLF